MVPTTRYQGSKRTALPWIYQHVEKLQFHSVLDAFGGTGSVSYLFKLMGKRVTFNDLLLSNYQTGIALIENNSQRLNENDVRFILSQNMNGEFDFIQKTFKNIYYKNAENKWLDNVVHNIKNLSEQYSGQRLRIKQALAYHALFQACLRKRPFNLFHRKNLNLRTRRVERNFGNKTTWEQDFDTLFCEFVQELSSRVISNGQRNRAICKDIFNLQATKYDLVYLDPPYRRPNDYKPKDYHDLYHFLEGLVDYEQWGQKIERTTKHLRRATPRNRWMEKNPLDNFDYLFAKFKNSIIVVSYGDPGIPSVKEIKNCLKKYKSKVSIRQKRYTYRLNHSNGKGLHEVLIIGE